MKSLSRAAAALLAAVAVVVVAPQSSPAEAKLAPVLTITAGDPNMPVEVPTPTADDPYGAIIHYDIAVAGGPATNVTVSVSGAGLGVTHFQGVGQATPGPVNLGTINTEKTNYVAVTAATGGFHQLTFTVTADGAAPAAATLNYVWAPTGAMTVSAGGDLQGTYFGVDGDYSENDTSYSDRAMLLFLTPALAYYGVPDEGLPRCKTGSTSKLHGCLAYAYDPATQLIQVGGAIGRVDALGVHTIGLGITDVQGGDYFAQRHWTTRLYFPTSHNRYSGSWIWEDSWFCPGVTGGCREIVALTLRRDSTFVLTDNWRKKRTVTGRYEVFRNGRMVLRGKFGKEIHTFAVFASKTGRPKPKLGVALGFGKGRHTDVFFLEPKKKK